MANETSPSIGKIDIQVELSQAAKFFSLESAITALLVEDDSSETLT